jgi:dTDP-4-dehydrorhamnose 3,5-epimerase
MQLEAQYLPGLLLLKPTVYGDHRGYFLACYHKERFFTMGLDVNFIQDNQSLSQKGTIRGLHYQLAPYEESKL